VRVDPDPAPDPAPDPVPDPPGDGRAYEADVAVRYRDLDPNGHVNHAVYASFLEHARTDYYADVFDRRPGDLGHVIVRLAVDYRAPARLGDDLTVAIGLVGTGETSVDRAYAVRRADGDGGAGDAGDDRPAGQLLAEAETTHVFLDDAGEPAAVPDRHRDRLTAYHRPGPD